MQVVDARTGQPFPVQDGAPQWRPGAVIFEKSGPYKWELFIPHNINGMPLGGTATDIWVYESGTVSWPGREVPRFANAEEAKAFVEATWLLEESGDGGE